MLAKRSGFYRWSQPFRARYGTLRGLRFASQWRRARYAAPRGTVVHLEVPGIRHPVYLRAQTVDVDLAERIFLEDQVDLPVEGEPAFIVDAGANIGLTAAYFASRWPRARVVAIEVEAGNFALLERTLAPYPNVTPMLAGLWSGPSELVISNPDAEESWAFMAEEAGAGAAPGARSTTVPALGVPDLMRQFGVERIDLLKIDIEGAEREVLGADAWAWLGRVGCTAVELHDWFVPGCRAALDRAVAGLPLQRSELGEYTVLKPIPGAAFPTSAPAVAAPLADAPVADAPVADAPVADAPAAPSGGRPAAPRRELGEQRL
jgi:FkbM family methyltransferase